MDFARLITRWYKENKRDLPWRNSKDAYFIWLSEIILQQTRVAQGTPYYLAFTENFPTVFDLANASEQEILKLWQGLGYYSRARNLHQTAQFLTSHFNGEFPNNYDELLKLKGVGEYTAAAIASFCFDEAVPVVDGNVFRVLARVFNIQTDIQSAGAKKEFKALAQELMPKKESALFNQAIMEFGALQCVPKSPNCTVCPLNQGCLAFRDKLVDSLPAKQKKLIIKQRFFNYIVFVDKAGHSIIQKRHAKGIWHNLYEFPLIETSNSLTFDDFENHIINQEFVDNPIESIEEINPVSQVHKLTHQHLYIKFWRIAVTGTLLNGIDYDTLRTYPFPIVLYNFIENEWK